MNIVKKKWTLIKWLLLLGSFLAAIKLIFVDYSLDEEYQIVMAYRRIQGDTLFGSMWEPHQTSAFGCAILLRIFMMATHGTEGGVVFLRICTTLIQLGLAIWLYRVFKERTGKEEAFLLGLLYFNYVPKLIEIPEFSNLQLWFFTVTVLALIRYFEKRQWPYLFLAGVGMSLEVLSYPSCLTLFPFFLVAIFLLGEKKRRWLECLTFGGTCAFCGAVWLLYVLHSVSWDDFIRNVGHVLSFDSTHNLDIAEQTKGMVLLAEGKETMILFFCAILIGALLKFAVQVIHRENAENERTFPFPVFLILAAEIIQLYYWIVMEVGYEKPQIMMLTCLTIPLVLWVGNIFIKRESTEASYQRRELYLPLLGSIVVILSVLYMSDLGIWNAAAQGILGAIFALWALGKVMQKKQGEAGRNLFLMLLVTLCFVFVLGKGYTVKFGVTETNTIKGIKNVVHKGPAKNIFSHYMLAYIMDSDYEDFTSIVEPGEKVMIVTNMVGGAGTTPYMFGEYEVCHFSIVDPTTYDEKLLTYWELYPEKKPDVIVVDCWYGQLMEAEDNWIMNYIENDYGYTEKYDGKYVRFYKK